MNEKNNPTKQTKVAIAVLRGATIPSTAKGYRISQLNCKRMVNIYCARSDRPLFDELRDDPYGNFEVPLNKLREHAETFIIKSRCNDGGQIKINEQSSIWDLPDVQTLTLTALWERDVKTIADLLKHDKRKLLRMPKLGKIGLKQLENVLERHGFEIGKGCD
jgi:hypothetical protein